MERELGKGAMGVVFLGRDPVIGRRVALKTIRAEGEDAAEAREFAERFLREAQAAGTLSHPNIVTVHDVGEELETGTSFIAMEYVEGKNLKQILKDKVAFSHDRVAEIVISVADALDYAHRRGIVHRDVKPANIILTPGGTVKIMDFGIARMDSSSLTATGQFLGTPNYMSPEQVTSKPVDGRSDLFSLGVVLYELLTKKKPFAGDNLTSISYRIVHDEYQAPQTYDAAIPAELNAILARALAKDPEARFQRGMDFVQALSEFRARNAEMEMLKGLGEMVAQAERLGPVSAVESKESLPAPAVKATPPPAFARPAATAGPLGGGTTSLEDLARRGRSDLDPSLIALPRDPIRGFSSPEWSLDTDAFTRREEKTAGEAAPHEPDPSSPGTLIAEVQAARPAAELARPPERPERSAPPAPPAPANDLLSQLTERIQTIPSPAAFVAARAVPKEPPREVAPPAFAALSEPPRTASPPPIPPPPPPSFKAGRDITGPIPARPAPRPSAPPAAPSALRAPGRDIAGPAAATPIPPRPGAAATGVASLAAGPQAGEKVPEILKREVNRRFVYLVVSGALLLSVVVVGLLVQRSCAIAGGTSDETAERVILARKKLLADGSRMLSEGHPAEARIAFTELLRQAPNSAAARAALEKADAALVQKEDRDRRLVEAGAHLAAAREAGDAEDYRRAVAEADAALVLVPDFADANELRAAALAELARKGKASGKKAAERIRPTKAAPKPAVAPTAAPEPAAVAPKPETPPPSVPTPSRVRLRIAVTVSAPQGYVMLRRNDVEVFRRTFDFGRKSGGGSLEGDIEMPAGPAEFKAWVISTDRSINQYKVVPLTLGAGRTLALDVDASKNLVVTLR